MIGILSHAFSVPQFATQLAELISLGVGIDYSLFIVSRHRRELLAGRTPEEAAVRALNTSGRAVFVAGLTVCIALLGMFALGLTFLYGVSLGAAFVVVLTMLSSLTLLPAMLGFYGDKALSRRDRRALRGEVALDDEGLKVDLGGSPFWKWWSAIVQRRSAILSVFSLGLIVLVALPFFSMRLGLADSGEDPSGSTTRAAYDLLAQGFGPGFNGPLQVVGKINSPSDLQRFHAFVGNLAHESGVARVLPPRTSPNGKAAVVFVYPNYTPQAAQTTDLVNHIRSEVPTAVKGSTLAIHVGGETAGGIDFSNVLAGKLPLFVVVIVVLAFLLLAAVFRSVLVPLVASVMNILSIGAALGAITAAFQWGWLKPVLGFSKAGPIEVYLPVMMFAVLFGLSMDYEVFLVSRMHEEWLTTGDNTVAVSRGQAETGRVITAAGLIMILVFLSFSLVNNALVIQEFGIGFAGRDRHRRLRRTNGARTVVDARSRLQELVAAEVARPGAADAAHRSGGSCGCIPRPHRRGSWQSVGGRAGQCSDETAHPPDHARRRGPRALARLLPRGPRSRIRRRDRDRVHRRRADTERDGRDVPTGWRADPRAVPADGTRERRGHSLRGREAGRVRHWAPRAQSGGGGRAHGTGRGCRSDRDEHAPRPTLGHLLGILPRP